MKTPQQKTISVKEWLNELLKVGTIHRWEQVSDTKYQIDFDFDIVSPMTPQEKTEDWRKIAKLFHDTYERLAPEYGYETRKDTKEFDPKSSNGKLMIAVCTIIIDQLLSARDSYWLNKIKEVTNAVELKASYQVNSAVVEFYKNAVEETKKVILSELKKDY